MGRRRRRPSAAPTLPASPLDDDDLLEEILLRLPPQPSSLPRASIVSTRWRRVLTDPRFLRRFREHHRTPPLLGFFAEFDPTHTRFISTMDPPDRIPDSRFSGPCGSPLEHWQFFGCRHGLAVLMDDVRRQAVLWDPLTGRQRRVPSPPGFNERFFFVSAAAMCASAEDGHVHGDCSLSPFKLVLVRTDGAQAFACLYESQSGVWGNIISTATADLINMYRTAVLIGSSLYWLLCGADIILQFDFERQSFGVIEKPPDTHVDDHRAIHILRTEDGGLGLAFLSELSVQLWERKSSCGGLLIWVLQKTIQLNELFLPVMCAEAWFVGYDEDANAIFLSTSIGNFMLQLEPVKFTSLSRINHIGCRTFFPYRNFYGAGGICSSVAPTTVPSTALGD